ncbi:NTP transferase domain-containing protein [Agromyces atrinae]|uniref:molybdenum cofactor guanylyltransferase n=1 Tax=Agromyces atrinae TaxID=592376 RepID=UPI001F591BEE|nr:NTP transferase domain-containing protein [Agromyces atrinae]MCI2957685.1 NTP transferase domain-containing protein [Agromyces atrinae]
MPHGTDAIVLSGGRGSRLGGVDKGALDVGGEHLIDIALAAARSAGAARVVVSGADDGVDAARPDAVVREDPAFGGPVAGIAAALPLVSAPWVIVLACDLPFAGALARRLGAALPPASGVDAVVVRDGDGRAQWLAAAYRADALRDSITRLTAGRGVAGASMRQLVGDLVTSYVDEPGDATLDVDTPADLVRARSTTIGRESAEEAP